MKYLVCETQYTEGNDSVPLYTLVPIDENTVNTVRRSQRAAESVPGFELPSVELRVDFPICYFSSDEALDHILAGEDQYQVETVNGFYDAGYWVMTLNLNDYETEPFCARLLMTGDGDFRVYLANNKDVGYDAETVWVKANDFLAQGE